MESVGTFEAKTHLTKLLERVSKGERIVITNRGKAVAMLVPPDVSHRPDAVAIGRAMLAYRDRVSAGWAVRSARWRTKDTDTDRAGTSNDRSCYNGSIRIGRLGHLGLALSR